jgi:hypothetical protein
VVSGKDITLPVLAGVLAEVGLTQKAVTASRPGGASWAALLAGCRDGLRDNQRDCRRTSTDACDA